MGFGRREVSSEMRVPRPPARITAFIGCLVPCVFLVGRFEAYLVEGPAFLIKYPMASRVSRSESAVVRDCRIPESI